MMPRSPEAAHIAAKEWRAKNRERHRAYSREWNAKNPGVVAQRSKKWVSENKERHAANGRKWRAENTAKFRAITAKRRAFKKSSTPAWANEAYIEIFYQMRDEEAARLGVQVDVDHIVPLVSDIVCGLHCEHNLQLLVSKDNRAKSNKWWPDMPEQGV